MEQNITTLGVALGRSTHTLLWKNGADEWEQKLIANAQSEEHGVGEIFEMNPKTVVMTGNREWGTPLAYFLQEHTTNGLEIRYLGRPREKGKKFDFKKYLRHALESGMIGCPFLAEQLLKTEEINHPWYRVAHEYLRAINEVRRAKHLVLSTLSILFPEVVKPSDIEMKKGQPIPYPVPPGIWNKNMKSVRENPDPELLQSESSVSDAVQTLAKKSLGQSLPKEVRTRYMRLHQEYLANLVAWEDNAEEAMARLKVFVREHPMAQAFPTAESAIVLCALIGWRVWPDWRELRSFAGLAVTQMDAKGNMRISRVRGEVRQYAYLLLKSTVGKEMVSELDLRAKLAKERGTPIRHMNVKRIEKLLKELRKRFLKPPEENREEMRHISINTQETAIR